MIIVFDTEYTAWQGSRDRQWSLPHEHREIVQIGAVRLGSGFEEQASFEVLVRPQVNATLSDYFIALTGLTQSRVDAHGLPFAVALDRFVSFVGGAPALLCNGTDHEVIEENCALHGIDNPLPRAGCCNIRGWLSAALGSTTRLLNSSEIPGFFGETGGREHDALSDARCVAAGVRFLCRERGLRLPVSTS